VWRSGVFFDQNDLQRLKNDFGSGDGNTLFYNIHCYGLEISACSQVGQFSMYKDPIIAKNIYDYGIVPAL